MRIYPGNGATGFSASYVAHAALTATQQVGIGLWNTDGSPDSLVRRSDGSLVLYPGNGPGGLTGGARIGSLASRLRLAAGRSGDVSGDGRPGPAGARTGAPARSGRCPAPRPGSPPARRSSARLARFDLAG